MAFQMALGSGTDSGLVATAVSAAGTTQGTATTLTAQCSTVTTVASGAGVILHPLLASAEEQVVFNGGANALKVYPVSGMQINALPVNTAMLLGTNTGCIFKCVSSTQVFGVLSA